MNDFSIPTGHPQHVLPKYPSNDVSPPPPAAGVPLTVDSFHAAIRIMLSAGDKVSDLIFSPGRQPQVELTGDLKSIPIPGLEKLTPPQIKSIVEIMLAAHPEAFETLGRSGSTDISYSVNGVARFRVNIFRQRGTYAIVMRVIPTTPPNWQELDLPDAVRKVAELKNGIVLVTGPTGSGKSTTLAAIIDLINATKAYHIVTIEDPIEFLHEHKMGTVHQRELHSDTPDFALALRAALRQAPKVILVGEMRDRETIEVALEAAETGHLVLSTLHTIDAAKTIDRIIGVFPKSEEAAIRTRLSQSFRRIISQRLLPKVGGGRKAAIEILISNSRTREYIEMGEKEGRSLTDAMRDGDMEGMQTFDDVLEGFIRDGSITRENGLAFATNANNLILSMSDMPDTPRPRTTEVPPAPAAGPDVIQIEGFER